MAARPQQSNRKTLWIVMGAVSLIFTYFMMQSDDTSSTTAPPRPHSASSTTAATGDDVIYPEDATVQFASMSSTGHDIFQPLIYRKSQTNAAASKQPNAIPPDCAGGDPNWTFTGSADINNVAEANFENDKSGEYAQVDQGQHWKTSTLVQITPNYVVLAGPSGNKKVLMPSDIVTAAPKAAANPAPANVAPVNPLAGQIGVDPNADAATVDAAAAAAALQQQFGGGRRGRRGGGGFGGGRGGRGGGGGGGGGFGGGGFGGGG